MFSATVLWLLLAPAAVSAAPLTALTDCLTSSAVPQLLTTNSKYALAIKPFNLRLPFTPAAVAQPTTVAQVQAAIACGVAQNFTVTPKSGGHSYASHGLGGENGHLMVDMKYWTNVTVDSSTQIATIGVGSRLGNVAQALYSQGGRAISHGTCPGVGIGGHVAGGGYGYISHTQGLAMDNLVGAQMVLANGTVATLSATENPDLFWAIRGAGASFGIITYYKFQTFAAPNSNIVYSYNIQFTAANYLALQNYANTTMPAEMNMRMFITSGGLQLEGIYYGSQSAFQAAISPILSQVGNPYGSTSTMGWIQGLSNYAYMSLTTPIDYDIFSKSLMTVAVTPAAAAAFVAYYQNTARTVSRDWYLIIDLHGGPTSAISKVPMDSTSYAHRNALFKYEFYDRVDSGSYPSTGFSFLNGWVASLVNARKKRGQKADGCKVPTTTFGMYINYADSSLTADQAHNSYWLTHYARLSAIKKSVDPNQVFSNPQAINSK
ncbi:FAD-linked oxidoreductase azaL [Lachnellula suecica]|uniref:FAD-linked oxidoreductase azaL n=1 Tax=Lachnellula suecica TaxID=602035 RepID=A0A8T9CJD5_9HELO|nr:FAD-linked oxidoreductase azaL [Lachnellula suecica]